MPRPRTWILAVLCVALGLGHAAAAGARTAAQETPPAETAPAAAIQEPLIQAALEGLPEPPAFVRLVRVTLQPGASVPLHSHPGPEFGRIESGTVTVQVEGPAVVAPASAAGAATRAPVGDAFDLAVGDQIVYPAETPFEFSNQTERPSSLLSLLIVPAGEDRPPVTEWTDGTPESGALVGVEDHVLGQSVAVSWPAGPLVVLVDRLALAPGEGIPASPGPVMLAVETGRLGFTVVDGQFQISRGEDELEVVETPTGDYRLNPDDAVFFPGGISAVPRPPDDGLLVLVRLSVLPVSAANGATPAPAAGTGEDAPSGGTPVSTDPPGATPSTGGGDGFGAGTVLVVAEAGVRLRDAPSTVGAVVAELDDGQNLVVVGPAEEGDGILWYPVEVADDPSVLGYVAEDFVERSDA